MSPLRKIGLFLSPVAFFILLLMPAPTGFTQQGWKVLAMAILMLGWWITEAVPIPVTALLPLICLPLLGVSDLKSAAAPYSNPVVFLFMGGFMIALAMEKWNLHRRIALAIIRRTGTHANGIILGFMLATAFVSMWISNTATTLMMLPIALSVIHLLQPETSFHEQRNSVFFSISLMLGIAYASSIGGMATLIGTPPNVVFKGILQKNFGIEILFFDWLMIGLPLSACLLFITYRLLIFLYPNGLGRFSGAQTKLMEETKKLGPLSESEKRTAIIFAGAALLWVAGGLVNQINPWFQLSDEVVAMLATVALFVVPVNFNSGKFILNWKDTEKLPWGILLLFGGGLSLAEALAKTGLIDLVGQQFAGVRHSEFWVIIALATVSLFLTEVMSNVALVSVFVPVTGGIAQAAGLDVVHLTVPVTMAASCAFMLPMSTPPNAIVFASGKVTIGQMARAGFLMNLATVLLIGIFCSTLLPRIFN